VELYLRMDLEPRDILALALTCRANRGLANRIACAAGVSVRQDRVDGLQRSHAGLESLTVAWVQRSTEDVFLREWAWVPRALPPPAFARLRRLRLEHCRVARGFWAATLAACPALQHVSTVSDFMGSSTETEVREYVDLVVIGAPRLRSLALEGKWHCPVDYRGRGSDAAFFAPVASDTLRSYRAGARQASVPVDAALDSLGIEDDVRLPLAPRLGPRALAATRTLSYRGESFGTLAAFGALRDVTLRMTATNALCVSTSLASLAALPASVESLDLSVEGMWAMRGEPCAVEFGEPLARHGRLTRLAFNARFPPDTVQGLLGGWLGAPALREASASFAEPAAAGWDEYARELARELEADPEGEEVDDAHRGAAARRAPLDPGPLAAWLARRPAATVALRGLGDRLRARHPRLTVA
jgi:hypothetical protein